DGLGNSTKVSEGILQAPKECFGVLSKNRFAIGFAGIAQDDPEEPGLGFSFWSDHRRGGPEVYLGFLCRLNLDAPNSLRVDLLEAADKSFDRFIRADEAHFLLEILVNALRAQTTLSLLFNQLCVRIAEAFSPHFPGGRNGTFWLRAGGRNGGTL